ncbi:glutathione S-transferase family protein [Kushneria marisflavi]|uniref:Glutathione S-transferase n=1 Tax=Kushneria marisflavi TaxID=157779 RepID=A0A240UNM9_9GAMM|nr:glutathione S-transferase family protein [Kushneria marisflavi]ART62629.1 glutathione S-transferase [Kushneria marisflavi]RKD83982.1 glutathione S-transferase [Kushneria marisflavi]
MRYRLHIANKNYSSWSMRPWVLMHALDIPFEEVLTPFEHGARQPSFDAFSPTGKVPCLIDGSLTVWDSLAICEYLAEAYPEVWPHEPVARAFARCAAAEMHSGFSALRDECSMNCRLVIALTAPSEALTRDLKRLEALWCSGLDRFGGPWLAGDRFTAVDAFFAPVAVRVRNYQLTLGAQAMAYVDRLMSHPSVTEWVTTGIQEPWREGSHEQDCIRDRQVIKEHQPPIES